MIKDYIIDTKDKSVRGSFINMLITMTILAVTLYGLLFSNDIIARIEKASYFIIGFFTASLGIWSAKKHMGDRLSSAETMQRIKIGNKCEDDVTEVEETETVEGVVNRDRGDK